MSGSPDTDEETLILDEQEDTLALTESPRQVTISSHSPDTDVHNVILNDEQEDELVQTDALQQVNILNDSSNRNNSIRNDQPIQLQEDHLTSDSAHELPQTIEQPVYAKLTNAEEAEKEAHIKK